MEIRMDKLTTKEWSRLKQAAGLEKNRKLFQSDASVGQYVDAFEKTGARYKASPGVKINLDDLKATKALEKFLASKDLAKMDETSTKGFLKDAGVY